MQFRQPDFSLNLGQPAKDPFPVLGLKASLLTKLVDCIGESGDLFRQCRWPLVWHTALSTGTRSRAAMREAGF
jgi:hypothetical protein